MDPFLIPGMDDLHWREWSPWVREQDAPLAGAHYGSVNQAGLWNTHVKARATALWSVQHPLSRTVAFTPRKNVNLLRPSRCCLSPMWGLSRFSEPRSEVWHGSSLCHFVGDRPPIAQFQIYIFLSNTNFRYSVLFSFPINHRSSSGNSATFIFTFSSSLSFCTWNMCRYDLLLGVAHVLSGKYIN